MKIRWWALVLTVLILVMTLMRPDDSLEVSITEVEGDVTVASVQGVPRQVSVGERLLLRDRITTGEFGSTTIGIRGGSSVTLPANSEVTLTDISTRNVRIELESGALSAVIRTESGVLTLAADGRLLVSSDASLRMQLFEDTLTVDVSEGDVQVQGMIGLTTLEAGKRAMALRGSEAAVSRRTGEMLLAVSWPESRRTRGDEVMVKGSTEPGAWVTVSGGGAPAKTRADAAGGFSLPVMLTEGENALALRSVDAFGEESVMTWRVERDSTAPRFRGGIE
jgi:hypothetical protein